MGKELVGGNGFGASRAPVKHERAKDLEVANISRERAFCKKESGGKHHKDSNHL